ncbi:hypothetical protein ABWH93_12230 [Seohaeicola saemankumensis]|jgi:hypothetical protein|uniref:hypothetical protein n=1 Tax=Seohaeicola TaxID=481178 RepID=UPI0035CF751D
MAYKVGTTIVIDDAGLVDWARIANKPAIGSGTLTAVTLTNTSPSSGADIVSKPNAWSANCYVESLSGGGTSGAVNITANRRSFNCNCNCRC